MRVGPWGTVQVICDVFKMLTKEIITIRRSDKFLYNLAPYIVILASVLAFACLPVNKGLEVLDFNVGVFFMMAASSIGVVGILLAGWSSNNKYSLIGAMRSGAQMISYELSIGLSILTIIVLTDTMQFSEIVARDVYKRQLLDRLRGVALLAGFDEVGVFGEARRVHQQGHAVAAAQFGRFADVAHRHGLALSLIHISSDYAAGLRAARLR